MKCNACNYITTFAFLPPAPALHAYPWFFIAAENRYFPHCNGGLSSRPAEPSGLTHKSPSPCRVAYATEMTRWLTRLKVAIDDDLTNL